MKVTYNDVEYNNIKIACNSLGISYSTILHRMQKGLSFNEAVSYNGGNKNATEYNGVSYKSLSEACSSNNLDYVKIKNQMKIHNCDMTEAVDRINNPKKYSRVTLRGVNYSTVKEACELNNETYGSVLQRMKNYNLSLEDAIFNYRNFDFYKSRFDGIKNSSKKCCSFDGKEFSSRLELAKYIVSEYNVDLSYSYIVTCYNKGVLRDKITKSISEKIEYNGAKYSSYADLCRYLNIDVKKFLGLKRKYKDFGIDSLIQEYNKLYSSCEFIFNGKKYSSYRSACIDNDLSYASYNQYYNRNKNNGISRLDALNHALDYKKNELVVFGVRYNNLTDLYNKLGINLSKLISRVSKNNEFNSKSELVEYILNNFYIFYNGKYYRFFKDILRDKGYDFDINIYNSVLKKFRKTNDIDIALESIDYCRVKKYFIIDDKDDFNSFFRCKCKKCKRSFVFTKDLAFKHIEECCNEQSSEVS